MAAPETALVSARAEKILEKSMVSGVRRARCSTATALDGVYSNVEVSPSTSPSAIVVDVGDYRGMVKPPLHMRERSEGAECRPFTDQRIISSNPAFQTPTEGSADRLQQRSKYVHDYSSQARRKGFSVKPNSKTKLWISAYTTVATIACISVAAPLTWRSQQSRLLLEGTIEASMRPMSALSMVSPDAVLCPRTTRFVLQQPQCNYRTCQQRAAPRAVTFRLIGRLLHQRRRTSDQSNTDCSALSFAAAGKTNKIIESIISV
ncbi:hypothetical protein KC345_g328 [Hortaea werneckii]|nr:hypothetical protein KC345_g328 [Hortaea werneckii]